MTTEVDRTREAALLADFLDTTTFDKAPTEPVPALDPEPGDPDDE